MNKIFVEQLFNAHKECPNCPSPEEVSDVFVELLGILFPDHSKVSYNSLHEFKLGVENFKAKLHQLLCRTDDQKAKEEFEQIVVDFFDQLPTIHAKLTEDISAMFNGDPAAESLQEVIRTYPGFYAIAAYRIAHALLLLKVTGIPRIITEHAHSKTGIDIHPGAKIGNHFCIDHGTGIVIGETCIIGNHVKMYQGVTLGALSINKEDAIRKRHPSIQDNVVLYAGATILGGETVVGNDSVIGGNVWLTRSVPPHSKIYYQAKMIVEEGVGSTDLVTLKTNAR